MPQRVGVRKITMTKVIQSHAGDKHERRELTRSWWGERRESNFLSIVL
jgi:hypothetical protein